MIQDFAHVKWFNTSNPASEPAFSAAEWLIVAAIVALGLGVLSFVTRYLHAHGISKLIDAKLKPLRPFVPLVVRISTAALLIINMLLGYVLAPNVESDGGSLATMITWLFMLAAISIGFGYYMRIGIIALLSGYLLTFIYTDVVDVLDHFEYLGIAGYLWLRGPGSYSFAKLINGKKIVAPKLRNYSLAVYRIGVGIGLSVLALSEKLLNPSVAQDFLNQYDWNLLSIVGGSDRQFILVAGAIELMVGVALIFNIASRIVVSIVLVLMILTALLLGVEEIYGHLFAIGIVFAVWVNDTRPLKNE